MYAIIVAFSVVWNYIKVKSYREENHFTIQVSIY